MPHPADRRDWTQHTERQHQADRQSVQNIETLQADAPRTCVMRRSDHCATACDNLGPSRGSQLAVQ